MAHTFLKPTVINRTALKLLEREIVLPKLVWLYPSADFVGAHNDTVTLRLPAVLASREYNWRNDRSSGITLDDLTETAVPVALNHDIYSAVAITDEQLTLDIVSFGEQVLTPQVKAVARGLEDIIVDAMDGATYAEEVDGGPDELWASLVEGRRLLNVANVPADRRVFLVGSNVEAAMLNDDQFNRADSTGDGLASSALQDATIRRLAGFTIVGSNAIDADTGFMFHPSAFAFANIAPMVPDGATSGSRTVEDGLALRWIRDYDPTTLRDRSVVSSFCGCTSVEDDGSENVRAVKFNLTAS